MKRSGYRKQLALQRIEAHRAIFKLETRILRAELDGRVRPVRQILGLGKQIAPLLRSARALLGRLIPRLRRDR